MTTKELTDGGWSPVKLRRDIVVETLASYQDDIRFAAEAIARADFTAALVTLNLLFAQLPPIIKAVQEQRDLEAP
jgi:hypothetical protein